MALEHVTATWDHDRLKRDRLALLQAEMQRQEVGALYLSDGPHVRYLLDVKVPGCRIFVPPEGDVVAMARPRDIGYVQLHHQGGVQLAEYRSAELRDARKDPAAAVKSLMAEHGVAGERLGIDVLKPVALLGLHEAGLKIVDAELTCERANTVKTQDEVTMYRAIGHQYRQTMAAFRDAIRPGVTEEELAALVFNTWTDVGGEDVAQLNICSQENMNPWGRWPTKRVLQQGDFIGIDLHGRSFGGLRGDSSTTFFVGDNPPPEKRAQYQQARDYLQAATKILRAGRPIADVMKDQPAVPEKYRDQQFNYHIAHGAGLGSSGYPHLDPRSKPVDDILHPNQVLAVEVFFAEHGQPWGVKFEEMILVRDGEPEILVGIPLDERCLV